MNVIYKDVHVSVELSLREERERQRRANYQKRAIEDGARSLKEAVGKALNFRDAVDSRVLPERQPTRNVNGVEPAHGYASEHDGRFGIEHLELKCSAQIIALNGATLDADPRPTCTARIVAPAFTTT